MSATRLKPVIVDARDRYKPVLSERERIAYAAAHRIMTEQAPCAHLATPGGRRSAQLDHIAKIIMESTR